MKVWEIEEGKEYIIDSYISGIYYIGGSGNLWMRCGNVAGEIQTTYNEIKKWDFTEYTPPTDWSKVEVDTKVLVRDWDNSEWIPRHFAQYKDGKVYTWSNGHTSFTSRKEYYVHYNQAKLYTE